MVMNRNKQAAAQLGERSEALVAQRYRKAGYEIAARNWRCFEGEIDIIARRDNSIVICEVKARASDRFMDPALAVSASKQAKIRTAAFRWLEENRCQGQLRFDVALVVNGNIQMIEAAF